MRIPEGWTLRLALVVVALFAGQASAVEQPSDGGVPQGDDFFVTQGPTADADGITLHGYQQVAGTFGDPQRALLMLPGVTHLMSGVAQPVIRGFQPATSQLRVDGVQVPMRFHLLGGPTTINPDFLGDVELRSGASPIEYGRMMGATIDAQAAERPDGLILGADLLNLSATWAETIEATRTKILISGRFAAIPALGAAIAGAMSSSSDYSAQLYDYQAKISQRLGAGELRLLALGASSSGGLVVADHGDTIAPYDSFHRLDLQLKYALGAGTVATAGATFGVERLGIDVGGGNVFGLEARDTTGAIRASVAGKVLPGLTLTLGGDVELRDPQTVQRSTTFAPEIPGTETPAPIETVVRQRIGRTVLGGAYVSGAYRYDGDHSYWLVEPSFRFDSYAIGDREPLLTYEPRLAVSYVLGPTTYAVSGGLYHQLPTTLIELPVISYARQPLGLQEVVKLDASVSHTFGPKLRGRGAVFVNPILRSVELSPFDPHFQQQLSWDLDVIAAELQPRVESGISAGAEVFLYAEPITGLSGWLSYTFTKSLRNTRFERYDELGNPSGAPENRILSSPLEREHVVDVVAMYALQNGWSFGANLHFNSGFPEAGNVASYTQREGVDEEGHPAWLPVDRDEVGRMPLYWRIDARVAKTWKLPGWSLQAYLDILNVAVNQEVLRFTYNRVAQTQQDRLEGNYTLERGTMKYPVILPMIGVRAQL